MASTVGSRGGSRSREPIITLFLRRPEPPATNHIDEHGRAWPTVGLGAKRMPPLGAYHFGAVLHDRNRAKLLAVRPRRIRTQLRTRLRRASGAMAGHRLAQP
jgi:hypothetical protein